MNNGFTYFKCNGLTLKKVRGYNFWNIFRELHSLKYSVRREFQNDITIEYKGIVIYSDGKFKNLDILKQV